MASMFSLRSPPHVAYVRSVRVISPNCRETIRKKSVGVFWRWVSTATETTYLGKRIRLDQTPTSDEVNFHVEMWVYWP